MRTNIFLGIVGTYCVTLLVITSSADKFDGSLGPVIGIDLGASKSCVAVFKDDHADIVLIDGDKRTIPSYVAFSEEGRFFGDNARDQAISNTRNTIFSIKRLMGRGYGDPEVQDALKYLPYDVKEKNGRPWVSLMHKNQEKLYAPEEISAMVLFKLKQAAEATLGEPVTNAVVVVPAYFNHAQKQAVRDAGTICGLNVIQTIDEPTLAAEALNHEKRNPEGKYLVFGIGAGSTAISAIDELGIVKAVYGNPNLGGDNFDYRVMRYFLEVFQKKTKRDASHDKKALQKLRIEVQRAKHVLSMNNQTNIKIDGFFQGFDLIEVLTRDKFNELNIDLFNKALEPIERVLKEAFFEKEQITDIVLLGGSTRIIKIQQLIKSYFNAKKLSMILNLEEAAALGAAHIGNILRQGGSFKSISSERARFSLGVETGNGAMSVLIKRNTLLPTKASKIFSTFHDNQKSVTIKLFEGESSNTKDNIFIGKFELMGITPRKALVPEIDVTIVIDRDSQVSVSAQDISSGVYNSLTVVKDTNRLSERQLKHMADEARALNEEDHNLSVASKARYDFEKSVNGIRSALLDRRNLNMISSKDRREVEDALGKASTWIESNPKANAQSIDSKWEILWEGISPTMKKLHHPEGEQYHTQTKNRQYRNEL